MAQTGSFVDRVEHVRFEANTLTLLLHLTTDAVRAESQRIRSPSAWSIILTPSLEPKLPRKGEMVGHLSGLTPPPGRPVLFPTPPEDNPCTGNPDGEALLRRPRTHFPSEMAMEEMVGVVTEPICRDWVISALAARAMEDSMSPEPYERWAFLFAVNEETWMLHKEAFAQASLIAAEVLSRREFLPEAKALLADAVRYGPQHAPFRAMALANHLASRADRNGAETLYRQLVVEGFDPWVIHRASLGRALNALEGGDSLGALAHVERASKLISQTDNLPGDLWVVGGEAALARNELVLARQNFERAARSLDELSRGIGLLRLADLELRAGRDDSAVRGWAMATTRAWPCVEDHVHLRRVITLEKSPKEKHRFLESTSQFSRCEAVRMEADFARAILYLKRGDEALALEPAVRIAETGVSRWGPARPHRAIITAVARSAVERYDRHRDFAGLISFFEAELEKHARLLDPSTRLSIGQAYSAVGAPSRGAIELLDLLTHEPKFRQREQLLVSLGEALLEANDKYRTHLVLRHLQTRYPKGRLIGPRSRLAARLALSEGKPSEAIQYLEIAEAAFPPGDRRQELSLDKARAYLAKADVRAAAVSLRVASKAKTIKDSELVATAITVLSECTRTCSLGLLRSTASEFFTRISQDELPPRLLSSLTRRGVLPEAEVELESSRPQLWSRLDALGVHPIPKAAKE